MTSATSTWISSTRILDVFVDSLQDGVHFALQIVANLALVDRRLEVEVEPLQSAPEREVRELRAGDKVALSPRAGLYGKEIRKEVSVRKLLARRFIKPCLQYRCGFVEPQLFEMTIAPSLAAMVRAFKMSSKVAPPSTKAL